MSKGKKTQNIVRNRFIRILDLVETLFPNWGETRKIGRNRFIQLYGIVTLVSIVLPVSLLLSYFIFDRLISFEIFLGSFILSSIVGYFFGKMWWEVSEKRVNLNQPKG